MQPLSTYIRSNYNLALEVVKQKENLKQELIQGCFSKARMRTISKELQ